MPTGRHALRIYAGVDKATCCDWAKQGSVHSAQSLCEQCTYWRNSLCATQFDQPVRHAAFNAQHMPPQPRRMTAPSPSTAGSWPRRPPAAGRVKRLITTSPLSSMAAPRLAPQQVRASLGNGSAACVGCPSTFCRERHLQGVRGRKWQQQQQAQQRQRASGIADASQQEQRVVGMVRTSGRSAVALHCSSTDLLASDEAGWLESMHCNSFVTFRESDHQSECGAMASVATAMEASLLADRPGISASGPL